MLSNPDLIKEAQTSGINVQEVEDDLKKIFLFCQNSIKCLENEVMNQFNSVAFSLENSRDKSLKTLHQSRKEIAELLRDLCAISGTEYFESSSVKKLLAKSRDLLEKPDTIQTKRPISGINKIEMPSNQWVEILESQLHFDFGQPGEIYLVRNMLESDDIDTYDTTTAPMMPPSSASDIGDAFEITSFSSLALSERSTDLSSQRRPSKTMSVQLPLFSNGEYVRGNFRRCESVSDMEHLAHNTLSFHDTYPSPPQISRPSLSHCGMAGISRNYYDQKTSYSRANFGRQVRFKEGWKGPVLISCVNSPSNFYVQLESGVLTLDKYRKFFSNASSGPSIDKKDIKIGNIYLAQCSDGEWYRVRFTQIIPNNRSVSVTQIDTGRKEMVDLSNIRRIDDIMKSAAMDPELAILCSIYDCHPVELGWRKEDSDLFTETLKDKKITMLVRKVQPNKLEVDLQWNVNGSYSSIRDYMLMSNVAVLTNRKDNPSAIASTETLKYFRDRRFQPKEWVDVKVTYVYGPHEIYVKRNDACSEKITENTNDAIDSFYKQPQHYKNYAVANLIVGSPVAAQFTIDNTWYRAEILHVFPQFKKAEVRYVDFGNKETVPFSRIRLLAKEFTRNTIRTVKCSLAGLRPAGGTKYKPAATNFLIKNVEDRILKMVVEELKDDGLSVMLFRSDENEDVCINLLLVEEDLAKKVGDLFGATSSYPKKDGVPILKPKSVVVKEVLTDKSDEAKPSVSKKANAGKSKKIEIDTSNEGQAQEIITEFFNDDAEDRESKITSSEELSQEDDIDNPTDQKTRYEVKIVSFISPNLFYVSLVGQLTFIHEMIINMSKFYREEKDNSELALASVETNVKCVAYSSKDDKWYRAKVIKVEENNEVTVLYKDIAREETVKIENLRALAQEFSKFIDGTVACHMADIEERSEWPKLLCESLMNAFDSYTNVYVTKMSKEKNKDSCPVEIWGKTVTCQGAFTPATEEWTNMNHLLLKTLQNEDCLELCSGTSKEQRLDPEEESSQTLEKNIGEIRSTETVKKWLHCNVIEAAEKGVEYGRILANGEVPPEHLYTAESSSHVAADTMITEDITPDESPLQDWMPPEPINFEEFEAWPTYLDDEFNFYVQNLGKQKKSVAIISEGLQFRYENTAALPTDLNWYPGQICIAWFFLDKKWYRGKVLKVDGSKAFVEYVDFGNTEWVDMVNLRKNITLDHIPIQCHKLKIRSDFVPLTEDGKWQTKILDFVHANVIEKKCIVTLRKEKGENFHRIEKLILDDTDVELFDYLCQLGYAAFVAKSSSKHSKSDKGTKKLDEDDSDDDSKDDSNYSKSTSSSSIAKFDSVSNFDLSELLEVPGVTGMINDPFSIPQNPQENEVVIPHFDVPVNDLNLVTVEVIEVLQLNQIVVHIVDSDNEAVNLNRKRFQEMISELQKKCIEQPVLTSPSLGRMCCTKFDDNVWYRAKIIDQCADNEMVNILYVDYGNSTCADPSTLREMKRSWFDVPMQSIRCRLDDFKELNNDEEPDLEALLKLINNEYEAVIEACDDSVLYKIKLYFK